LVSVIFYILSLRFCHIDRPLSHSGRTSFHIRLHFKLIFCTPTLQLIHRSKTLQSHYYQTLCDLQRLFFKHPAGSLRHTYQNLRRMSSWPNQHFSRVPSIWLSFITLAIVGTELVLATSIPAGNPVPTPTLPSFGLVSPVLQPSSPPVASKPTTLISSAVPSASNSQIASLSPPNSPASSALVTVPPSPSQRPSESFGWAPEEGPKYGNVTLRNHCNKTLYVRSEGGHRLGGFRDDSKGYGTEKDLIRHAIKPGENYTEPYRTTCAIPLNSTRGYCWAEDKLYDQGISMKISGNDTADGDITQFEYSLINNPFRPEPRFMRLEIDVSLLDCANPFVYPETYKVKVPPAPGAAAQKAADIHTDGWRDVAALTDSSTTSADHQVKIQMCPGYQHGIAVTFSSDTAGICPNITCNGVDKCLDIYTFDRTREGEASKSCTKEYRGDTVVDLCAGNGGNTTPI
jgi:hypothetical protein